MRSDPVDAFRCLCGAWVAVFHKECLAMADESVLRRLAPEDDR